MPNYITQINKLARRAEIRNISSLNVYDLDGTVSCYTNKVDYEGDKIPMLARNPVHPYIFLSARVNENRWLTEKCCHKYGHSPLAIFHRDKNLWSIEKRNLFYYKITLLEVMIKRLPDVRLTLYDDDCEVISAMSNFNGITAVMVRRIY